MLSLTKIMNDAKQALFGTLKKQNVHIILFKNVLHSYCDKDCYMFFFNDVRFDFRSNTIDERLIMGRKSVCLAKV